MNYYSKHPEKAICLDVETTGVNPDTAEILQLSIIDYNGNTLFNEYIKPDRAKEWPGAEVVHHISPQKVSNKPHLSFYHEELKRIFEDAELIIAYNGDHYDIPIIAKYGFPELKDKQSFDVMLEFAPIYGAWDDYHGSYTWQKLNVCADYYGYNGDDNFHNSLEDVRATLFCYKKMVENDDEDEDEVFTSYEYINDSEEEDENSDEYEYTDEDAIRDTQAFWEGAKIELEEQEEEPEYEYEYEYEAPELIEPEYEDPGLAPYRPKYIDLAERMHQIDEMREPDSGHYQEY